MVRFEEITKVRYYVELTTHLVQGGKWETEEEAMKAVPALEEIFHGKLVRIIRHEVPCLWRVEG